MSRNRGISIYVDLTPRNTNYSVPGPRVQRDFPKTKKFSSNPTALATRGTVLMHKKANTVAADWLGPGPRNADREAGRVAGKCQRCRDLNVHLFQPVYRGNPRISRGQIHLVPDVYSYRPGHRSCKAGQKNLHEIANGRGLRRQIDSVVLVQNAGREYAGRIGHQANCERIADVAVNGHIHTDPPPRTEYRWNEQINLPGAVENDCCRVSIEDHLDLGSAQICSENCSERVGGYGTGL
jgi:hypothetical protein